MKSKLSTTMVLLVVMLVVFLGIPSLSASAAVGGKVEGMEGVSPPTGTVATASQIYNNAFAASKAIDGDLSTYWSSGSYSGTIQLVFPSAINLNFVQAAIGSTSSTRGTYTVYGLKDDKWVDISSVGNFIPKKNSVIIMEPIAVTPGLYEGIKIDISNPSSWVGLYEITINESNSENIPNPPKKLEAAPGDSQATLNWSRVENADSYTIHYGTQTGSYTKTATATKDTYGNYVIPGLSNGTTYYFVVSATVNGVESDYSNEASATPHATVQPDPEPSGNRAILTITLTTGLEKEFDLSIIEVNVFLNWYDARDSGSGPAKFAIDKHQNNKGPFSKRTEYVIYDKILTFNVDEYSIK